MQGCVGIHTNQIRGRTSKYPRNGLDIKIKKPIALTIKPLNVETFATKMKPRKLNNTVVSSAPKKKWIMLKFVPEAKKAIAKEQITDIAERTTVLDRI